MEYGFKPYVFDMHFGVINARCFEHGFKGGMNYTIWVWKYFNGGKGGNINAPWKKWNSSLGIQLLHLFGHSQHGCMRFSSALCGGVKV